MKLAVVLPTYKERDNLEKYLPSIISHSKIADSSVIIVADDYTNDGTKELCKKYSKYYQSVLFYLKCNEYSFAKALRNGLKVALDMNCDYAIQMDSDGSHKPSDIQLLYKLLQHKNDLVLGIRLSKLTQYSSLVSYIRSVTANMLVKRILGIKYQDSTTGFHGFSRPCLKLMTRRPFKSIGFEVEIEIIYRAVINNMNITEVPVTFIERKHQISPILLNRYSSEIFRLISLLLHLRGLKVDQNPNRLKL